MRELLDLAVEKLRRRRRRTLLLFLVLTLSFGFILLSLSLERSMSYSNQEFRFDHYGEWYLAIPNGMESDSRWLAGQDWAKQVGRMETLGQVQTSGGEIGLGTLDQDMIQVGRLTLEDGRWPQAENEIVMEADALLEMGYSASAGQTIQLTIKLPTSDGWVQTRQEYLLCGILQEYSDLWTQGAGSDQPLLVSAVVSEAGASRLEAAAAEQGGSLLPSLQYFILTPQSRQEDAVSDLDGWLSSSARNGQPSVSHAYQNLVAYETDWNGLSSGIYTWLVALVAVAAVLCIYLMQMPQELLGFGTLRSIGMTRGQLAAMLAMEALLLCLPAALLGIGMGAAATWIILRLLMHSEDLLIRLAIPWGEVLGVLGLWGCGVLAARLFSFVITLGMPLTGRFQLPRAQASHARRLRRGGIAVLLALFGVALLFPCFETVAPRTQMEQWTQQYSYRLRRIDKTQLEQNSALEVRDRLNQMARTISPQLRSQVEQIPGVDRTIGVTQLEVGLAFEGMAERTVPLYVLEEQPEWDEILDLGEDREAFYRGELVLVCFPSSVYDAQVGEFSPVDLESIPLPQGEAELFLRQDDPLANLTSSQIIDQVLGRAPASTTLLARTTVPAKIRSGIDASHLFPVNEAYTLVCSQACLDRLLELLPDDCQWQCCNTGEDTGWGYLYVMCDPFTTGLSVDLAISELSQSAGLTVLDQRQQRAVAIQESLQMIVLICSAGGCIALILLLILGCIFSLEAEQQRPALAILRAIGMSRIQMKCHFLRQGALRGLAAISGGWILYLGYCWAVRRFSMLNLWAQISVPAERFGCFPTALLMLVCLLLPLTISMGSKRYK